MKQALIQKGNIILEEVPMPALGPLEVCVKTRYSLISTGTELSGLTMSKASLLTRAIRQPQNVKKALKMAQERGVIKTYKIIKGLLDFGTPTGYSLAGEVIAVGNDVNDIRVGDLVACGGAGKANHAEYVVVPRLLTVSIPQHVSLRSAASISIGAIALQGVRQADVRIGERVAVIGLGLIGQITAQILKASGCIVFGIDPESSRRDLALRLGADDVFSPEDAAQILSRTNGFGADACIITAATESDKPLNQAMEITRKRGTAVVVGAVGLKLDRSPWYEKEINLRISCSYGPGRYDASYEEFGLDYPLPYVRWTEERNMSAYLELLSQGKVNFDILVASEFDFLDAQAAYEKIQSEKPLATLLRYGATTPDASKKIFLASPKAEAKLQPSGKIRIGIIGAGGFAATMHLPNLEKLHKRAQIQAVCAKSGTHAKQFGKRYEASYCTTDYREILADRDIDAVLIATRHNLHAEMTLEALAAGKAVFVEKPLALDEDELSKIEKFFTERSTAPLLMTGFNRRFSSTAIKIKSWLTKRREPIIVNYRMNAGFLPRDHWTQTVEGGGRIIGEACHIFDLFNYFTGARCTEILSNTLRPKSEHYLAADNVSATITYDDGSLCHLLYAAVGHRDLPKEYGEIYCDGAVAILDDYKSLRFFGSHERGFSGSQDKGHLAELQAFLDGMETGTWPISLEEQLAAMRMSFAVGEKI